MKLKTTIISIYLLICSFLLLFEPYIQDKIAAQRSAVDAFKGCRYVSAFYYKPVIGIRAGWKPDFSVLVVTDKTKGITVAYR